MLGDLSKHRKNIAIGAVAVLLAGSGVYWFSRDDATAAEPTPTNVATDFHAEATLPVMNVNAQPVAPPTPTVAELQVYLAEFATAQHRAFLLSDYDYVAEWIEPHSPLDQELRSKLEDFVCDDTCDLDYDSYVDDVRWTPELGDSTYGTVAFKLVQAVPDSDQIWGFDQTYRLHYDGSLWRLYQSGISRDLPEQEAWTLYRKLNPMSSAQSTQGATVIDLESLAAHSPSARTSVPSTLAATSLTPTITPTIPSPTPTDCRIQPNQDQIVTAELLNSPGASGNRVVEDFLVNCVAAGEVAPAGCSAVNWADPSWAELSDVTRAWVEAPVLAVAPSTQAPADVLANGPQNVCPGEGMQAVLTAGVVRMSYSARNSEAEEWQSGIAHDIRIAAPDGQPLSFPVVEEGNGAFHLDLSPLG